MYQKSVEQEFKYNNELYCFEAKAFYSDMDREGIHDLELHDLKFYKLEGDDWKEIEETKKLLEIAEEYAVEQICEEN